ncbi:hypothetical protein ACVWXM_006627 [Bradyrhizobium sp. GM7.3]|jgi:hypothetical protein
MIDFGGRASSSALSLSGSHGQSYSHQLVPISETAVHVTSSTRHISFYWDDVAGRRLAPNLLTAAEALEQAGTRKSRTCPLSSDDMTKG